MMVTFMTITAVAVLVWTTYLQLWTWNKLKDVDDYYDVMPWYIPVLFFLSIFWLITVWISL